MYQVSVYLKSGNIVQFKCKESIVVANGGRIQGYTFEGMDGMAVFNMSEIEAIQTKKEDAE